MSKQWQKMRKHDTYYKQAKAHGYRSRAAYKLKQINNKFNVIRRGDTVLDLGAAPGGWSQVAVELTGDEGDVIGIDIEPIKNITNAIFLIGDITNDQIVNILQEQLKDNEIDVVLWDAAPNISGNYSLDQARSVHLAENAMNISKQLLKTNGNFVVKVFEGEDFQRFLAQVKTGFRTCRIYSPNASRSRSSEVYAICKGFRKK